MADRRRGPRDAPTICYVRQGYFPQDPRVLKQAKAAAAAGWTVEVVCLRGAGESVAETWNGIRIHRVPVRRDRVGFVRHAVNYVNFLVRALVLVSRNDRRARYDVVQVHNMPDFLIFAGIVAKRRGARLVLDMHELMPEFFAAKFSAAQARVMRPILELAERLSVRTADLVFTQNEIQSRQIRVRTGRETSQLHNVPDEDVVGDDAGVEQPPASRFVLFTHGTVAERYGIGTLIDAMPLVWEKCDAELRILGDGEDQARYERVAARLGDDRIVFMGRVPLEEVAGHIRAASLCAVPLVADGYVDTISPNKLYEYVALGRPVVASDLPGMREFFDSTAVEFFRSGDPEALAAAILRVAESVERREEMTRRATELYEPMRWRNARVKYVRELDGLIGRSSDSTQQAS